MPKTRSPLSSPADTDAITMSTSFTVNQMLAAAVLLAALLWRCWRWLTSYSRFRRLEQAIPGLRSYPLIGNLLDTAFITKDQHLEVLLSICEGHRYGLSRFTIGPQLIAIVNDPDDAAVVLRDPRFAEKPDFFYGYLERVCGAGILTSNGDLWKQHRVAVRPAFRPSVIDEYVTVFGEEAADLVGALRVLGELGASDGVAGFEITPDALNSALTRAMVRASMRTIMASDVLPEDEAFVDMVVKNVGRCINDVSERVFRPWLWPDAVFAVSAMGRRLASFTAASDEFGARVLARIRTRLRKSTPHAEGQMKTTFAEILAESSFSDHEILDEGKTLFGASVETNVSTLQFVLKVLSVRPDVQDRAQEEIDAVLTGTQVTADQLQRLPYLESVIKETLRLLPTFPLVARAVRHETELAGKTLPAGTMVLVNIFSLHRDPRHHPDPLRFDPQRFLGSPPPDRHPCSYLPFSAGPRGCIGQRYAMNAVKTTLAVLLRAFRVEDAADGSSTTEPADFRVSFRLSLYLVGGVRVRLRPRASVWPKQERDGKDVI